MMKKHLYFLAFIAISSYSAQAQTLYFPPTSGTAWDTLSPSSLGWCQPKIDSLYNYLEGTNTDAFIVLKDGKIVLEKYFGSFTAATPHYWASAGKSLTAMLVGIAQEQNLIHLDDSVSQYLGVGWTSATADKEGDITIKNLITMNSGLDDTPDAPCTNEDTATLCLDYLVDTDTRWAYHTGPYRRTQQVLSAASGMSYNSFTTNKIGTATGMTGAWFDGVFYSIPRSAARFGLLALNRGIWASDTILHDTDYFDAMVNTSQNFNLSYGYLWWLNGKASYMAPGLQFVFNGSLFSNAPADMFCALGKNDQKIYVVPSTNMVVVRMGDSAYGVAAAFSPFDDELWAYINDLSCPVGTEVLSEKPIISAFPNPFRNTINVANVADNTLFVLTDVLGQTIFMGKNIAEQDFSQLSAGSYLLAIYGNKETKVIKMEKE